jgi:hypothetical protein
MKNKIIKTSIKLPISLHNLIISSAENSNRSMNAEIVTRLEYAVKLDLTSSVESMKNEEIQKTSLRIPPELHDKLSGLSKLSAFTDNGFNNELIKRLSGSFDAEPAIQREISSAGIQVAPYPLRMPPHMREHFEMMAKQRKRSLNAELIHQLSSVMPIEVDKFQVSLATASNSHRVLINDVAYHSEADVVVVKDQELRYRLQQAMSDQSKMEAIANLLKDW